MAERVDKPELVGRVARRLDRDGETVAEIVDGFLEEIYAALKGGDSVSLRGFGSFYAGRSGTAGCSSSTRRSACARCLVGRRPTAGRCEPWMTGAGAPNRAVGAAATSSSSWPSVASGYRVVALAERRCAHMAG